MDQSVYVRPNKPQTLTVTKRDRVCTLSPVVIHDVLEVASVTECHVTPPEVAALMADYLGLPRHGQKALDPQAGTGNLINALLESGYNYNQITAIERHCDLSEHCLNRFGKQVKTFNTCFLEYAENNKLNARYAGNNKLFYQRIITNPPFKNIKKHMNAALELLHCPNNLGASLVALVPLSYDHPEAYTLDELSSDTFQNTNVRTKIIQIDR